MTITKFTALLLICISTTSTHADQWQKSFTAGQTDTNGQYMGGSETIHLTGHAGKLYAAVGYWMDERNVYYGGKDPRTGWAQILRLDSPNGKWQVDLKMGGHVRPETLKEITLTTDSNGTLLKKPITLLVAFAHSTYKGKTTARSFTRNNLTGEWAKSIIFSGPSSKTKGDGGLYSMRDIHVHRDTVTGIDRVFATIGRNGIFSGVYDPNEPGFIKWDTTPEMGPVDTRPLAIIEANGSLMFSAGRFIYQRIDGEHPTYRIAHDLSDLIATKADRANGGMRGLTAVPNPNGPGDALLFVWVSAKRDLGIVYRLEPNTTGGYSRHIEVTIADLMKDYLNGEPAYFVLAAYNEFLDVPGANAGETEHLIGFQSALGRNSTQPLWSGEKPTGKTAHFYRGAVYAIRGANLKYRLEEVNGRIQPNDPALVATRCYVQSPFKNENAIYFGGHDGNLIPSTNMAWIYKKIIAP